MATIRKRIGPEGTRFEAVIRRFNKGKEIYRDSKTFDTRADAKAWAKDREDALKDPGARARSAGSAGPTLAYLIRWYIDTFRPLNQWSRSKQTTLEFLEWHDIGKADARGLTAQILADHIGARRADGVAPSTAANDLIWIGCVLRAAKDSGEFPDIDPTVVKDARVICKKLRLIGRSNRRDVRPTPQQLMLLDEYFARRDRRSKIPMRDTRLVQDGQRIAAF